ncbi:MAG: hypothetical protein ABGY72_21965 [bacterium]
MPEFRGPDWRRFVRTHVRLPQMARHREERMLAELADHLENVYRDALSRGAGEDEARARPEQVRATVLRHGALVAGAGIACGLAGALGLSRFLTALTFEVSAQDPTVFTVVALLLGTIVLCASYVPARRATRVDPLTALRSE